MKNQRLKNNKNYGKATALLALIATKEEASERCLSPEEMAVLVDSGCSREELTIFMEHLSCCDRCYGEWLSLKKMMAPNLGISKGRIYHLSRRKKYSYIGSALAVAASVAVFLNITHQPIVVHDTSVKESLLNEPAKEPGISKFHQDAVEKDALQETKGASPPASAVEDSLPVERLKKRTISPSSAEENRQERLLESRGFSAPSGQISLQKAPKTAPSPPTEVTESDATLEMDVDSWLAMLKEACLDGRQDLGFWSDMHLSGEKILNRHYPSLQRDKAEKISALLVLLGEMGRKPVSTGCGQLLEMLAEEDKSR